MDAPAGVERCAETEQHRAPQGCGEMAAHVPAMAAQQLKQKPGSEKSQGSHQQSDVGLQELEV